ncbi:shikimate dehydrogenase [Butyrivibrio sp. MC2013]|uniref:shikimate dehydrogenase n=1 Tax=Butyrivibrio sp. MC2013 TaxID=1280686 RepID=UPI000415C0AE|nr:shikimate dehydrogenase [Butyrivibrio sp. MC2013]
MNDTDANTRVLGLLAHPAGHTLSPLIHNMLADELGLNLVYVPFDVKPEDLGRAVEGAYALGIAGMNATVPHKEAVMSHLTMIDEEAQMIGAVNTLVRDDKNGGYTGYNTDILGLERALEHNGFDIRERKVIILGAGGAARSAAILAARNGAASVVILNRTPERAKKLAEEISDKIKSAKIRGGAAGKWREVLFAEGTVSDTAASSKEKYLCIQCSSVGMHPDISRALIEDEEFYDLIDQAFDIIYRPFETLFLKKAKKAGARCANGLEMLLYQGVSAFELWTDADVSEDICRKVYGELIWKLSFEKNVVVTGYMGSGKTTVGKLLARKLGYAFSDTDSIIEDMCECTVSEIFDSEGEDYFRAMETKVLQNLLKDGGDPMVLSTGGGMPLRAVNRRLLSDLGKVVYLRTSVDDIIRRLEGDSTRPLLQEGNLRAKVTSMLEARGPIYEEGAFLTIDTGGLSPEEIAERIIRELGLEEVGADK